MFDLLGVPCVPEHILMMIPMVRHLYDDYADDALALVVVEFLALTKLMKIVDVINILT